MDPQQCIRSGNPPFHGDRVSGLQITHTTDVWAAKTSLCKGSLGPVGPDGIHVLRRCRASCWRELPDLLDPVDCLEPAVYRLLQCFQQERVCFGLLLLSGVSQPCPSEHSESVQPLGSEVQTLPLPQPRKTATTAIVPQGECCPYTKGLAK